MISSTQQVRNESNHRDDADSTAPIPMLWLETDRLSTPSLDDDDLSNHSQQSQTSSSLPSVYSAISSRRRRRRRSLERSTSPVKKHPSNHSNDSSIPSAYSSKSYNQSPNFRKHLKPKTSFRLSQPQGPNFPRFSGHSQESQYSGSSLGGGSLRTLSRCNSLESTPSFHQSDRRSIRFATEVQWSDAVVHDLADLQQSKSVWYSRRELQTVAAQCKKLASQARTRRPSLYGADHCYDGGRGEESLRGLEEYVSMRAAMDQRNRKLAVVKAVLEEQTRQRLSSLRRTGRGGGGGNVRLQLEERLRRASRHVSKQSLQVAHDRAAQDETDASQRRQRYLDAWDGSFEWKRQQDQGNQQPQKNLLEQHFRSASTLEAASNSYDYLSPRSPRSRLDLDSYLDSGLDGSAGKDTEVSPQPKIHIDRAAKHMVIGDTATASSRSLSSSYSSPSKRGGKKPAVIRVDQAARRIMLE